MYQSIYFIHEHAVSEFTQSHIRYLGFLSTGKYEFVNQRYRYDQVVPQPLSIFFMQKHMLLYLYPSIYSASLRTNCLLSPPHHRGGHAVSDVLFAASCLRMS